MQAPPLLPVFLGESLRAQAPGAGLRAVGTTHACAAALVGFAPARGELRGECADHLVEVERAPFAMRPRTWLQAHHAVQRGAAREAAVAVAALTGHMGSASFSARGSRRARSLPRRSRSLPPASRCRGSRAQLG